jgi:hypothetical protein
MKKMSISLDPIIDSTEQFRNEQSELEFTITEQVSNWISYYDCLEMKVISMSDAIFIATFITELNFKRIVINEYFLTNYNQRIKDHDISLRSIGHRFKDYFYLCNRQSAKIMLGEIERCISRLDTELRKHHLQNIDYSHYKYNHYDKRIFKDNIITQEITDILKEIVDYARY